MSQQRMIKQLVDDMDAALPYPPGLPDRLFDWLRRRSVSPWLFYPALWLAFALLFSTVIWIEGSEPVGSLSLISTDGAMYIVYYLALMHYLDGVASRALNRFRPMLQLTEADFAVLRYRLTTMPRRNTHLAAAAGVVITLIALPLTPSSGSTAELVRRPSAQLSFLVGNAILAIFIYHAIRQLRMVGDIHANATRVNLFRRDPAYAFSLLTARTAMGWILGLALGLVPRLGPFLTSEFLVLLWAPFLPLAILAFLLPLQSMRRLLAREKRRLIAEANRRLERAIALLHEQMDSGDTSNVGDSKSLLESLLIERDVLARIPTWPWNFGTLAGFLSTLLLSAAIWLVQQLLGDLMLAG